MNEIALQRADEIRQHLQGAHDNVQASLQDMAEAGRLIEAQEAEMAQAEFEAWLADTVGTTPKVAIACKRAYQRKDELGQIGLATAFLPLKMSEARRGADTAPKGGVEVMVKWKAHLDKARREFAAAHVEEAGESERHILRNELRYFVDLYRKLGGEV